MKIIGNIHDDLKRKYPISRPYILYIRIVYTIMYEIIASAGPNMNKIMFRPDDGIATPI